VRVTGKAWWLAKRSRIKQDLRKQCGKQWRTINKHKYDHSSIGRQKGKRYRHIWSAPATLPSRWTGRRYPDCRKLSLLNTILSNEIISTSSVEKFGVSVSTSDYNSSQFAVLALLFSLSLSCSLYLVVCQTDQWLERATSPQSRNISTHYTSCYVSCLLEINWSSCRPNTNDAYDATLNAEPCVHCPIKANQFHLVFCRCCLFSAIVISISLLFY